MLKRENFIEGLWERKSVYKTYIIVLYIDPGQAVKIGNAPV